MSLPNAAAIRILSAKGRNSRRVASFHDLGTYFIKKRKRVYSRFKELAMASSFNITCNKFCDLKLRASGKSF
jgi:hypothetical protein